MNITTREACAHKLIAILILLSCAAALYAAPTGTKIREETGKAFGANINLSGGVESRHAGYGQIDARQGPVPSFSVQANSGTPSSKSSASPAQLISNPGAPCPQRLLTPVESVSRQRIVINLGIEYEIVPYCNSLFIHEDLPLHLSPIQRARNLIVP